MYWYFVCTMKKPYEQAASIFRERGGILRMSEAIQVGVSRRTLYAMRDGGVLEVLSRGVYRLASLPGLEQPDLVAVATRVPKGVVCLISALAYHELTTQIPRSINVAVAQGTEPPRIDYPPVSVYWFSGEALEALRNWRSRRGVKIEVLLQYARVCRVERVMRAYLEALS